MVFRRPDKSYSVLRMAALCILVVTAVAFGGCSEKTTEGVRAFRIEGNVVDRSSSIAIDSAQIDVFISGTHERTVLTDTSGYFDLQFGGGTYIGDMRILVAKQGYASFDTLISRLENNLKDWIVGITRIQGEHGTVTKYENNVECLDTGSDAARVVGPDCRGIVLPENNGQ